MSSWIIVISSEFDALRLYVIARSRCNYRDLDDLKQLVIGGFPNTLFLEHLINQIRNEGVNELLLENLPHLICEGDEISA